MENYGRVARATTTVPVFPLLPVILSPLLTSARQSSLKKATEFCTAFYYKRFTGHRHQEAGSPNRKRDFQ